MPDEATPTAPPADAAFDAPATDTPTDAPVNPDGQGDNTPAPDDAQEGYLRHADYTRKTQELAEQRKEWEAQQAEAEQYKELVRSALIDRDEQAAEQLLSDLGYEFEDDQDGYADPEVSRLQNQLNELSEWKAEQQAESQARENAIHIEREFLRLDGESWAEDNPFHDAVVQFALAADPDSNGRTNVEAGFEQAKKLRDFVIEQYKQSKIAPDSDQFGSSASAAPVENASLDERVRLAMERNGL